MKKLMLSLAVLGLCTMCWAGALEDATDRLDNATNVVHAIMGAPDSGIPEEVLEHAKCIYPCFLNRRWETSDPSGANYRLVSWTSRAGQSKAPTSLSLRCCSDSRKVSPTNDRAWKSSGTTATTCPLKTCGLPYSAIVLFLTGC